MLKERVKQILEWIHATVLFPLWIPVLYELADMQGKEYEHILYIKSFLIVIPVVVTGIAAKKCKSLFTYIGASATSTAFVIFLAWILQPPEYGIIYVVGLGIECGVLVTKRFADRLGMSVKRQDSGMDPFWQPSDSVLNQPSFGTLGYFVVIYVVGIVFSSKTICDEAFFTALLYVFVIFLHTFLVETSDYLQINRQVKGLPVKRIYGIAGGMLGFFMILIFFLCIPSVLMISMRQYADIRTWADGKVLMIGGMDTEISQETFPMVNEQLDMLIDEQTESKELPVWINVVLAGGTVVVMCLFIRAIIKEILNIFSDFRETYDENGDRIELLEEDGKAVFIKHLDLETEDIETKSVRRRYRKMIRKHRKQKPEVYESPAEIEAKAGLSDNKEMQKLHIEYEAVRYGR